MSLNTMSKKFAGCLLLFLILQAELVGADWKVEVSGFFGQIDNYRQAVNYLLSRLEALDREEKPLAYILLAYSYEKLAEKDSEYKWLGQYFEKCRGYRPQFDFLDEYTTAAVIDYLTSWLERFPLITEVAFLDGKIYDKPEPPAKLLLAVHMANSAYYRLSAGKNIISGGIFNKGLNVITLKADRLFDQSGRHLYFLDVKADDLVLRKEIEIDIQLEPSLPEKRIEFQMKNSRKKDEIKNIEYKLSMFIGDKLIVSSRKIQPYKLALKLDIPLTKGKYQPFGPVVDKASPFNADPLANSFSIPQAIASLAQLLKGSGKKSQAAKKAPPPQEKKQIEITFIRKKSQGIEEKVDAALKLKAKTLKVFAYK